MALELPAGGQALRPHDRPQVQPGIVEVIVNYSVFELRDVAHFGHGVPEPPPDHVPGILRPRTQPAFELGHRRRQDENADRCRHQFAHLGGALPVDFQHDINIQAALVMPMIQRRKPGRIVTLSSVSGLIGNRGQVNYSAAKAGIIGATKALALELAKRNITVNCVAPGLIDTDMLEGLPLEDIKQLIPLRRLGTTKEVAAVVAFLMSEDAAYITRQVISVNGGLC